MPKVTILSIIKQGENERFDQEIRFQQQFLTRFSNTPHQLLKNKLENESSKFRDFFLEKCFLQLSKIKEFDRLAKIKRGEVKALEHLKSYHFAASLAEGRRGAPDLCLSNQGNLLFPCTIGIPCSATGNHHPHSGPHSHYKDTFHNISSNNVKQ